MSTTRPQRRQKQKAQQRLGVYGSYLARGQYTREEEHQDDGDYRERLSAAELRKRKAEREAKEKEERELEDKAKQDNKAGARPSKKLKSSDGSSQEVDEGSDRDARWASDFLLQSSQSQEEEDALSPKTLSYSLSPSSPPFAFNIVIPEFDESQAAEAGSPLARKGKNKTTMTTTTTTKKKKKKKRDCSVSFDETVTVRDRRGRTTQFPLAPGDEESMQNVVADGASPPPPRRRRNLRARAPVPEKPAPPALGSSEDDDDEEEDEDEGDEYNVSEEEEESTNTQQQLAREKREEQGKKEERKRAKEKEKEKEAGVSANGRARNEAKAKAKAKANGKAKELTKPAKGTNEKKQKKKKTAALFHRACLKHLVPEDHCEVPERLSTTIQCIEELHDSEETQTQIELFDSPSKADLRWVKAVHDASYVQKMSEKVPTQAGSQVTVHATLSTLEMESSDANFYTDTFMSHDSWAAALYAAGAVIEAVDLVMDQTHRNAVCAVRPPGHHCGRSGRTGQVKSQGFCLLNNVAIGAKYALLKHDLHRIAIIDFDVHAGNGTEEIFAGDDNFLFISIHAVGESFYPETGHESGGNVVNLPLPHCTTAATYRQEFEKVVRKLDAFAPQFLFLSSGFDGHKSDPIRGARKKEGFALTGLDYHHITTRLLEVAERHCEGKVVSVLEGGYDVGSRTRGLAESFKAHVMALMGCSEDDVSAAAPAATKRTAKRTARKRTAKPAPNKKADSSQDEYQEPAITQGSPLKPPPSPATAAVTATTTTVATRTLSPPTPPRSSPSPTGSEEKSKQKAIKVSPARGRPKPPVVPATWSPRLAKRRFKSEASIRGFGLVTVIDSDSNSEGDSSQRRKRKRGAAESENENENDESAKAAPERKSEARGSPIMRRARRTARSVNSSGGSGSQEGDVLPRPKGKRMARRRTQQVASSSQSDADGDFACAAFTIQVDRMEGESSESQSSQPSQTASSSLPSSSISSSSSSSSSSTKRAASLPRSLPLVPQFDGLCDYEDDPLFMSSFSSAPSLQGNEMKVVLLDLSQQPDGDDEETQLGP